MSQPTYKIVTFKIEHKHWNVDEAQVRSITFTAPSGAIYMRPTKRYRTGKAVFYKRVTLERALYALCGVIGKNDCVNGLQ